MEDDICAAVLKILRGDSMIHSLYSTYITLIPKKCNPTLVTEYQPINLCNVVYKLVFKILTNRLKPHMHSLISKNGSDFILGRFIIDNIMIAHEFLHSMKGKTKGMHGTMAIKFDMNKVYDRMEWGYLEATLNVLGFNNHWRNLFMSRISTFFYLILLNGSLGQVFQPSRGLQQGGLLSLYLFLLCIEGLSTLSNIIEHQGEIRGFKVARSGTSVNHLLFADDSILFSRASKEEWGKLKTILQTYEKSLGQMVNKHKSFLYFSSNISEVIKKDLV